MKKEFTNVRYFVIIALISVVEFSCTDHYEALNTNPVKVDSKLFDPALLLSSGTLEYANVRGGYNHGFLLSGPWVQSIASCNSSGTNYYSNGDKYVASSSLNRYAGIIWNKAYSAGAKFSQIERLTSRRKDKDYQNLVAVSKILKILTFSTCTETYGDIPYSEGLRALDGIVSPKYDKQEDLYPILLKDLDKAISELDKSKSKPSNDIIYGNSSNQIDQWVKFGYSIMLRMALRLIKADPTMAKLYAEKAITGGVFSSNKDSAIVLTDYASGYSNENAIVLHVKSDFAEIRWGKRLIDYMNATSDPRLSRIAEIPPAGIKDGSNFNKKGDSTLPQQGMPNGYDFSGGNTDISKEPDYPGPTGTGDDASKVGGYSRPTPIYRNRTSNLFLLTYPSIELMLAECAVRGYVGAGNAKDHYKKALAAAVDIVVSIGAEPIKEQDKTDFVNSNPLDITSNNASLEMINMQYWVTSSILMNFHESWVNWRRTGVPNLTAVNYPGNFTSGKIPIRQPYPTVEGTLNKKAYDKANVGNMWTDPMWINR